MIRAVRIEVVAIKEGVAWEEQGVPERTFTPDELAYCNGRRKASLHLAARFAAKKAILKALCFEQAREQEEIPLTDIEIRCSSSGRPFPVFRGAAASRARHLHITGWHLSLTHTDQRAAAFVIAEEL